MASMVIRPAEAADHQKILAVYREVQSLHHAARPDVYGAPRETLFSEDWLEMHLEGPSQAFLVAAAETTIAGLVQIVLHEPPDTPFAHARRIARIDALGVLATHRRQGIGTRLMRAAHDWAQAKNADTLQLGVDAFNEGAVKFYRSLGFEVTMYRMNRQIVERK